MGLRSKKYGNTGVDRGPKNMGPKELERAILSYSGGGGYSDSISPHTDSAMRVMTVYSCVTAISNAFKQLPKDLILKKDGFREEAKNHPLWELLTKRPNSWMTCSEFDGMLAAHYALRGNFVAIISRDRRGVPLELLPVHPDRINDIVQNPDYSITYKIQFPEPMGIKPIAGKDIFHVRGLTLDGVKGLNKIEFVRQGLEFALSLEAHGATTFKNGAFPNAALETDAVFETPEEAKKVLAEFEEVHGGSGSKNKVLLLTDGMKFKSLNISYPDLEFLNNRKFQKKDIVGLMFSIPIDLMSSGDTTTFASATEFNQSFSTFTIAPLVVDYEQAIARDIIGRTDTKAGYYTKKNMSALLRSDPEKQMKSFVDGINAQIYNPNEVRGFMDMNPYEGGDEYQTRTSTTKTEKPGDTSDEVPKP